MTVPDLATARKLRGAFFTPQLVAQFVVDWAVRSANDRVLEPSCGEAAFLVEAARRLQSITDDAEYRPHVDEVPG